MNRFDLQELADLRVREAELLLNASLYDGAYYLAGYAVECALKACIAKQTKEFDFPDRTLVNRSYTHKLSDLIGVAGLQAELEGKMASDREFSTNWETVRDWSQESRYERHEESKAKDFYQAITDERNGVLTWLRVHW